MFISIVYSLHARAKTCQGLLRARVAPARDHFPAVLEFQRRINEKARND